MINQELLDYIRQQSVQGISQENIKSGLLMNGWTNEDINEAYNSFSATPLKASFNKKFIWIPVLVLLVGAGGVFAFQAYKKQSVVNLPTTQTPVLDEIPTEPVDTTTATPTTPEAPLPTNDKATTNASITSTPSWKLYKSDFAGISFEYPDTKDIKVTNYAPAADDYGIDMIDSKSSIIYSIRAVLDTKYLNSESLITNPDYNTKIVFSLFDNNISHYSKTSVGGNPAYQLISTAKKTIYMYAAIKNNSYHITVSTLGTLPEDFIEKTLKAGKSLEEATKEIEASQPDLDLNNTTLKHFFSSIKFFPPLLTQQKKDLQSASQDVDIVTALFAATSNLDNYALNHYVSNYFVYPASIDELYADTSPNKSFDLQKNYMKYKNIFKYAVSPDKKHFHIGIGFNAPQLTEAQKRLKGDSDFNSKSAGWVNGFDGTDPIYDQADQRENN